MWKKQTELGQCEVDVQDFAADYAHDPKRLAGRGLWPHGFAQQGLICALAWAMLRQRSRYTRLNDWGKLCNGQRLRLKKSA